MIVGIVGSEAAKFTTGTEALARVLIRYLLSSPQAVLCSGHCHLGGVDIFAEEIAQELGRETIIYPPKNLSWSLGYRPRNLQIAATSDVVHCITLERLPEDYQGMRFSGCYHCGNRRPPHVKSGGCWTALRAKNAVWHIIGPEVTFVLGGVPRSEPAQ